MCTVTWLHQDDGYLLFCNRDERRTRAQALGPAIHRREGVLFIAPTDPSGGGTWIGVNQFGIALCLLNGVPAHPTASPLRSRGLLLPELLSASSQVEARHRVTQCDLSAFAPFTLAILQVGQPTGVLTWDGRKLAAAAPRLPLVSSSFDPAGVRMRRRHEFRRRLRLAGALTPHVLAAFHTSHGVQADAYSPCMHRPDAATVSFSCVRVTGSAVRFAYSPGAPCHSSAGQESQPYDSSITLDRSRHLRQ